MRRRDKRRARSGTSAGPETTSVAGPSTNAATNLLIADIAMRGMAILMRRGAERGLLRGRFGSDAANDIVKGRPMSTALMTSAAARVATRSVPGFLLVSGGLLAKAVLDRSMQRRKARRTGDKDLLEQAENAPD